MKIHEKYINRCIELAKNGLGLTYSNPMVGSVIVHNNKIIGEGWHQKAGKPHAEVHAINAVKNKELLKDSTIYVSLEPCSHYGKTPPCSDLIVRSKIPNVVIGALDTNSLVSGKGVEHLVKNGCNVEVGILKEECLELNKRFYTFHNKKRPYIILKWAESKDGFIDIDRNVNSIKNAQSTLISNNYSRQLVHQFRAEEQAILIGTETVIKDNPKLNVRTMSGNNPIRVVLDQTLRIPTEYHIFDGSVKTIVFVDKSTVVNPHYSKIQNLLIESINFEESVIEQLLNVLYQHEIQSVIVEGGKQLLESFIDKNYWDEARVFVGSPIFINGVKAPFLKGIKKQETTIFDNILTIYQNASTV
ncbi:MAG TPA: bifunctional diaminohydroxyphosphoribosylaminopyrimidine deaminase/5-amino-6-(5-phosphoribosylamino)uracil reductase RibD [Flavobacteriaceae bacterium]|nr:bifunctional diaminohydroxyphosphoribosylaminopyrimidine deaminase/5-amino-6-(5-phosphoribosylamino)uracil reductase RibD [Flavobacteriaceae bacterium]